MIIPCTRVTFINDEKGNGVIATKPIRQGTITWFFDDLDRTFSPQQFAALSPTAQENVLNYSYTNNKGELVFCWDNERFINHSFKPNCILTPYGIELAVKDIEKGEELTNDYGFLNIIEPFPVDGDDTGRRHTVFPDDLLRHSSEWDQLLRRAFDRLPAVNQPLQPYLPPDRWQAAMAVAARQQPMQSIRTLFFDRQMC